METRKLKILAIDDNRDNLITLQAVIADVLPGTEVLTSLTGRRGIELAETEDPDVILKNPLIVSKRKLKHICTGENLWKVKACTAHFLLR